MKGRKMEIVEKDIGEVFPYENNPRKNESAIEPVAKSLKEFGWRQPIVIDKNNVIIVGHTRWEAAQMLGLKKVPCLVASDLTEEQANAYRLADNKTNEFASWDAQALIEELSKCTIDMEQFGFDDGSIEEEKYSEEIEKRQTSEEPTSRIIVASISIFGKDSQVFAIKPLDEEESEKLLEDLTEDTAAEICEKIHGVLQEMTA
jgi:ParB-like chromosome segregation protein Spo0J